MMSPKNKVCYFSWDSHRTFPKILTCGFFRNFTTPYPTFLSRSYFNLPMIPKKLGILPPDKIYSNTLVALLKRNLHITYTSLHFSLASSPQITPAIGGCPLRNLASKNRNRVLLCCTIT
jgi:hypothetical protein